MANVTKCKRCGVIGVGEGGSPNARPFRKALRGYCTACVVCKFFQDEDDGMGFALPQGFDPQSLLLPHVQQQFAHVLAVGQSELKLADVDWNEVIAKWAGAAWSV